MTIQGCIIRALALLLIATIICSYAGAVKIQTSKQYPDTSLNPDSSPSIIATSVFSTSTTPGLTPPYKTNSWLSPIFWADSQTSYYPSDYYITKGETHPLYQMPVYPLPWSLYYCKTTPSEVVRLGKLNCIDPDSPQVEVPTGLFIRPMPIFSLYDTRLYGPEGQPIENNPAYHMYSLAGKVSAPSMKVDPGFDASHIRVSRMGDYDAGLLLSAADDKNLRAGADPGASLAIDLVRGSPFVHLSLQKIPSLNLSLWHGSQISHESRSVTVGGKDISCEIITTPFKSWGAPGPNINWTMNTYWQNQTVIFFYPKGSATYSQLSRDPIYQTTGEKSWLFNRTDVAFTFTAHTGPNYLVMATVPSPEFTDSATLQTLAAAAFRYPTGSSVTYQYSPESGAVQATYALQTADPLQTGGTPIQGLLPLHYGAFFSKPSVLTTAPNWVQNGNGAVMVTDSILGDIKYLKGATFTCTYQYPGILPHIPSLPAGDTEGRATLAKWLKNAEEETGSIANTNYQYTLLDVENGKASYDAGKLIWSTTNLYRAAQGVDTRISANTLDSAKRSISLFFADTPKIITAKKNGQAPYYAYYDPNAATIILYPAGVSKGPFPNDQKFQPWDGYGTATVLNDHHYTWGYFISAAAEIAFDNTTWMEEHKDVINQLVYDVAYSGSGSTGANNFKYPKIRMWDPYIGHCEAVGMIGEYSTGNNDESISEEIHFWAGVIRWGSASNQKEIETLGIQHYTQAVYAYYTFWRDYFHNYQKLWDKYKGKDFDPVWLSKGYAPQIWDGMVKSSLFFNSHPAATMGISIVPMTGASFYHAMDTTWISSLITQYHAYVAKYNDDPLKPQGKVWQDPTSPWSGVLGNYALLSCWYALADPAQALSQFFWLTPEEGKKVDPTYQTKPENLLAGASGGITPAETYHFIRFLQDYGTPNPLYAHATNTPYFMTFQKDGGRTYVGYNPTGQAMNITFSDNTVIRNVLPHQFGFYPYGFPGTLQASFTASPLSGSPPLTVTFTDTSRGQITGWSWDFGDKTTSDLQSPVHTFTNEGNYLVTLTVTGPGSKTSTTTQTIRVISSGQLPGNFSISTLHNTGNGEVTTGLSPSLAISTAGVSHLSFFSANAARPWKNGIQGHIGYERIEFTQGHLNITKQVEAVPLTYNEYPGQGVPEWGRASLVLDQSGTPLLSYIDQTTNQPQKLGIAWMEGDSWMVKPGQEVGYGWTPSVAITKDGVPGFAFVSASVNGPCYGFQPPELNYKTKDLGVVYIEGPGAGKPTPETRDVTLLYSAKDQSYHAVYYNTTKSEIRHAWATNPLSTADWTKEVVQSGVTAGAVCAAYDTDTNTLGIAWYDKSAKKLMLIEKTLANSSWSTPQVIDTPTDATCSLGYGPATGVLPGPGISYYDGTDHELRFAWREGGKWYHVTVDSGGAGSVSSLAYGTSGYPHIAYRHDTGNALKYAYLTPGSGGEASFASDVRAGAVPLTVHFWDTTFNDTVELFNSDDADPSVEVHYWWDLNESGEWGFEDVENPVFTYQDTGTYDVKMLLHLKIDFVGEIGSGSDLWMLADMGDYITATSPQSPSANFTATPVSGTPPLEVAFTDTSGGSPTAWRWKFGDGAGSGEQNPVHTYTGVGRHTVTLETSGPAGDSVARKPAFITVDGGSSRGQAGMLRIHSDPAGADIYLDGILQGQTPVDELLAKTGSHTILVHLDGYQNWSTRTEVPAGEVRIIPTIKLRKY